MPSAGYFNFYFFGSPMDPAFLPGIDLFSVKFAQFCDFVPLEVKIFMKNWNLNFVYGYSFTKMQRKTTSKDIIFAGH